MSKVIFKRFCEGDLVTILPPEGASATEETLRLYEKSYKGNIFRVTRVTIATLSYEVNYITRITEVEEVEVQLPWGKKKFFADFVKLYDGLQVIFDILEEMDHPGSVKSFCDRMPGEYDQWPRHNETWT